MRRLKISSQTLSKNQSGLISPEGKFYDLDMAKEPWHGQLAQEILEQNPELKKEYLFEKAKDRGLFALSFLLKKGWVRVAGNSDISQPLSFEFDNLNVAQKVLRDLYPASGIEIIAEVFSNTFRGDISKFFDWNGKPEEYVSPFKNFRGRKSMITKISQLRKANATQERSGWISPEGKYYPSDKPWSIAGIHNELAKKIIKSEEYRNLPYFKEYVDSGRADDLHDPEEATNFLLSHGWSRFVGTEAEPDIIQFESTSNLDAVKNFLKNKLPDFFGNIFFQYQGYHFSGDVNDFMKWNGRPQRSLYDRFGKKASALTRSGWVNPLGKFYPLDEKWNTGNVHNALAKKIILSKEYQQYPVYQEWKDVEENYGDEASNFLMERGWVRVLGTEVNKDTVNLEAFGNLEVAQDFIRKNALSFTGKVIAEIAGNIFRGPVDKFLNWSGQDLAPSLTRDFRSKKKKSEEYASSKGLISPEGKVYTCRKILFEPQHWDLIQSLINEGTIQIPKELKDAHNQNKIFNWVIESGWVRWIKQSFAWSFYGAGIESKKLIQDFIHKENYFGTIIVDLYEAKRMYHGDAETFLKRGFLGESSFAAYIKKKSDLNSLTRNIDTLVGPATHSNPNGYVDEERQDIYPGQKEKLEHRHEGGEDDEFVHTHPTHCPRYDLRKLKIVDEDDSGED